MKSDFVASFGQAVIIAKTRDGKVVTAEMRAYHPVIMPVAKCRSALS